MNRLQICHKNFIAILPDARLSFRIFIVYFPLQNARALFAHARLALSPYPDLPFRKMEGGISQKTTTQ
ncbi:MAG: hypothetical protein DBX55_10380 [Verrucomicrobia bacterium]|nr:MAG: hypothetical protein DBX55_10380 [Verrucomicrobiota bacterium]